MALHSRACLSPARETKTSLAFADIFIAGAQPVTEGAVMKFLNRARELAQAELVEVIHHLPCVVFYEHDPESFVIGPVTFTLTARFLGDLQTEIEKYRRANAAAFAAGLRKRQPELSEEQVTAEAEAFADRHVYLIRRYYEEFDWVASVQIPAAHAGISQTRAERAVDAALDVLRLFVPTFPERYRRAGAPNTPFETRELMTDATGKIISAMRQGGRGAPSLEGWYEGVKSDAPELWNEFERAVEALTKGDKLDDLTQRLVDALHWFGQAVVDDNPAAALVKYAAGLERLTITGHVAKGLEAMVIRRVAYLNHDRTDMTPDEIKADVGKLYQMRSDLMHGSISPYDPAVPPVLRIGWEVGRWGVLRAALVFRSLRSSKKTSRKDLAAHYEEVAPTPAEPAGA